VGARFLRPFGLEIWSIESWQDNSPRLPVSNFHNLTLRASPEKFPHGMKWLAERIRDLYRGGFGASLPAGAGVRSTSARNRATRAGAAPARPSAWLARQSRLPTRPSAAS